MKSTSIPFTAVLLAGCLFILSSCRKEYLYFEHHPQDLAGLCQIKQLINSFSLDPEDPRWDTIRFTYNAWGDPVSGLRKQPATGAPNFLFRYDKYHRLTDFIGAYSETGGEFWTRYSYANSRSQYPYADTEYIFPLTITGPPPTVYLERRVAFFEYDAKGRITKITTKSSDPHIPDGVDVFTYNPDGSEPGATYDDKVNLSLTNKIWMFLNRSYSPHNLFTATAYNAFGLPTWLDLTSQPETVYYFIGYQADLAQFVYDCPCQAPHK